MIAGRNRFRGDPSILAPGMEPLAERTVVPVRGVLPMRRDIAIGEEDRPYIHSSLGVVDVCVLRFPTVANFTDLGALGRGRALRKRDRARLRTC